MNDGPVGETMIQLYCQSGHDQICEYSMCTENELKILQKMKKYLVLNS